MSGRSMTLDVLVRLRDNLSGPLRRLRGSLQGITDFTRRIGVLSGAIAAISFMGPIQEAAAFQQQLLDIAGTADLSGRAAFAFVDEMQGRYEDLAVRIGQHSQTIAEGAGQMIAAGLSRELIDGSIKDIGEAATAANAQFSDMAQVATSMMKTLDVPAAEIRDALGGLVIGGKEGAFELKDMAAHFPKLTSQVAKFGVKGREAVDFLASALQIARMGTSDPATAANNLNNFLSKALAPLTKKKFAEMGVDIQAVMLDAVAKGINPIEAMLQKIGKLTGSDGNTIAKYMGEAKKRGLEGAEALAYLREQLEAIGAAGKISELFQDQQVLDFLIPFMANVEEYKRIKDRVAAATGQAIDADFDTQMQGINRQLTILREIGVQSVRQVGLAFGAWLPTINEWLLAGLTWVREFDKRTGGWMKTALMAAAGGVLLATALGALTLALPIVGAGFGALAAAAGLLLSPIGLLIGAIGAGAVYVWKNWDRYGPRLKRLWSDTAEGGRRLVSTGRRMWSELRAGASSFGSRFIASLGDVRGSWRTFVSNLSTAGSELKAIFKDIGDVLARGSGDAGLDAGWLGSILGAGANAGLNQVKGFATDLRDIATAVRDLTSYLSEAKEGSWTRLITDATVQTVRNLVNPLGTLVRHLKEISGLLGSASGDGWWKLFPDGALKQIQSLINPLKSIADAIRAVRTELEGLQQLNLNPFAGNAAKPGDALPNGGTMTGADDGRASALDDFLSGPPRAPAQPQAPVRLDGNINATIKVQGPGTVTGVSSDNDRVKVGTGRMVGNQ